jgi:hypothetical protein
MLTEPLASKVLLISDGELNIHTGVDSHGSDVLYNTERRLKIDDTLMDLHLEAVPSLGTYEEQ